MGSVALMDLAQMYMTVAAKTEYDPQNYVKKAKVLIDEAEKYILRRKPNPSPSKDVHIYVQELFTANLHF
jgi:hypothetical protein